MTLDEFMSKVEAPNLIISIGSKSAYFFIGTRAEYEECIDLISEDFENAVIILFNDPKLKGALAFNEFEHAIVAKKTLPWRPVVDADKNSCQWTDADDAALRYYLERVYGMTGKDRIFDAVNIVANDNAFHPVRDYLNSCTWDGVPRVDTLLVDYLGAEDSEYVRTVTRKTLTAAVARIYKPGCKFDYILTLQGHQGAGKSTFIRKLGVQWGSDSLTSMQGKEAYEQVLGVWIIEIAELSSMKKAEVETIKLFISKQTDRFRPAYGRRTQEYPRQCVFFGTTNETQFLRDATGNRRFWIVDTPELPPKDLEELTPETVRLIWGEAVENYRNGEKLYLSKEMEAIAREIQESFEEENPKAGLIQSYLDRLLPENWDELDLYERRQWLETNQQGTVRRLYVCTAEIWAEALGGNPDRLDRYGVKEIREIMARLPAWKRKSQSFRTFHIYGQQRYYVRVKKRR